jgi:hypothetical protein
VGALPSLLNKPEKNRAATATVVHTITEEIFNKHITPRLKSKAARMKAEGVKRLEISNLRI